MKMKSESEVAQSCVQLFTTPWTVAHQAPPTMGFARQEYWSGVPAQPGKPLNLNNNYQLIQTRWHAQGTMAVKNTWLGPVFS